MYFVVGAQYYISIISPNTQHVVRSSLLLNSRPKLLNTTHRDVYAVYWHPVDILYSMHLLRHSYLVLALSCMELLTSIGSGPAPTHVPWITLVTVWRRK